MLPTILLLPEAQATNMDSRCQTGICKLSRAHESLFPNLSLASASMAGTESHRCGKLGPMKNR